MIVKYIGGVAIKTPFGLVKSGDTLEVSKEDYKNLNSTVWEKVNVNSEPGEE